jgi:ferredoxin
MTDFMKKTRLVYFSPTGTTKKVVEGIAAGIGAGAIEHLDLTPPSARPTIGEVLHDGITILGVPVYAGRVPVEAARRLRSIRADREPAVVVAVYGNRAYEDALLELRDLAVELGFIPVAGAAFIGEHSFAAEAFPIANGRPDENDLGKARDFGILVREKMAKGLSPADLSSFHVPGNFPYKEWSVLSNISPVTRVELCNLCGACAPVCPVGAIIVDESVSTDRNACIRCCACIKNCPPAARVMEDPAIRQIMEWLSTNFRERKAPEFFL